MTAPLCFKFKLKGITTPQRWDLKTEGGFEIEGKYCCNFPI
jgi:hypothetical protein